MLSLSLALALAALQQPPPPEAPRHLTAQASLTWWWPTVTGSFDVDGDCDNSGTCSIHGTDVTFDRDLGIRQREGFPVFEAELFGSHEKYRKDLVHTGVGISFWEHGWTASKSLARDNVFDGTTFPAGTLVKSRLRADVAGMDCVLELTPGPESTLSGAFRLGVRYLDTALDLRSAGLREQEPLRTFLFGLGGRADWHPVPVAFLTASASVHVIPWEGTQDALIEASAGTGVEWGPVRIEGGYRVSVIAIKTFDGNKGGDFTVHGPMVGVTLRF